LEKEADVMGEKAMHTSNNDSFHAAILNKKEQKINLDNTSIQFTVKSSKAKIGELVWSENNNYMIIAGQEEVLYSKFTAEGPRPKSLYTRGKEIIEGEELCTWTPNVRLINVDYINKSYEGENLKKMNTELIKYLGQLEKILEEDNESEFGLILKNSCMNFVNEVQFLMNEENINDGRGVINTSFIDIDADTIKEWMHKNGIENLSRLVKIGSIICQDFGKIVTNRLPGQKRGIGNHYMIVVAEDINTKVIIEANAAYDWERPKFDFINHVDELLDKTETPKKEKSPNLPKKKTRKHKRSRNKPIDLPPENIIFTHVNSDNEEKLAKQVSVEKEQPAKKRVKFGGLFNISLANKKKKKKKLYEIGSIESGEYEREQEDKLNKKIKATENILSNHNENIDKFLQDKALYLQRKEEI